MPSLLQNGPILDNFLLEYVFQSQNKGFIFPLSRNSCGFRINPTLVNRYSSWNLMELQQLNIYVYKQHFTFYFPQIAFIIRRNILYWVLPGFSLQCIRALKHFQPKWWLEKIWMCIKVQSVCTLAEFIMGENCDWWCNLTWLLVISRQRWTQKNESLKRLKPF